MDVDEIAMAMAAGVGEPDVQQVQTRFRAALAARWGIAPGDRVLEVGCGQGDMTAVLANLVGPRGHVTAVDLADPDYGAPVTLGDSAAFLKSTPLGERIDFRFGFDVLGESFENDSFDHVVLSQCAWYFADLDQLRLTLARLRPWAHRLCFAEWDLTPTTYNQLAHLIAIQVQGLIEATGDRGDGNVRTPFSQAQLIRILTATGWRAGEPTTVDTTGMHDAHWEIESCKLVVSARIGNVPPLMQDYIRAQMDLMESVSHSNEPLPVYSVTATR